MERDTDPRTDEQLVADFVGGDRGAFEEIVRRHEDRIFALALRFTRDRTDALDATQETFLHLFRKAEKFRGDSAFGTWLYRIGINASLDLLRKKGREPLPQEEIPESREHRPGVDAEANLRIDLQRALARLSEDYREAVTMHDIGGIPYEEIARSTGVSVGTVKSRISRGRRRLYEIMEQTEATGSSKGAK